MNLCEHCGAETRATDYYGEHVCLACTEGLRDAVLRLLGIVRNLEDRVLELERK